jgi:adenine-specific DNA-methyltransferase
MIDKRQSLNEKTDQWFTLNRGTSHPEVFQREKIVCPQRSKGNTFGYNDIDWYAASDVFYLTNPKPGYKIKYILALLNSKLYYVWLYNRGKRKGESLELTATPLSEIPIALADESTQNKLIAQIDKILSKLRKNISADITAERKEIDSYIYRIYDLTEDEINIIEGYK